MNKGMVLLDPAGERGPSNRSRTVAIIAGVLGLAVLAVFVGGFLYWKSLEGTPQFSLAMLIDAARRDDQASIDRYIDTGAVVEDFVPQITSKAVELYGRGISDPVLQRLRLVAAPILPSVKERARAELPRVIRERTDRFENIPFAAMVIGVDRYLHITHQDDIAIVRSKLPEHAFEVKMRRAGREWQIIGVKDDRLSTDIARKVGQEMILIAAKGLQSPDQRLGIGNLADILRQAEEAFR